MKPPRSVVSTAEFNYEIPWPPAGHRPGHHQSMAGGSGLRFREHVPLLRDPDARRIDLHATLRDPFGDIQVRVFRERRAITVNVLADVSASMGFGDKWDTLVSFCAAAGRSAYRTGDAFACLSAAGSVLDSLSVAAARSRSLAATLEARLRPVVPHGDTSVGLLEAAGYLGRHRSLVFVVSDFHAPLPQTAALLAALARHAVVPVIIWDRSEFTLPAASGWYEAKDLETGARRTVWLRPAWRAKVRASVEQRQRELRALFADAGTRPLLFQGGFAADRVTDYFAGSEGWPDAGGSFSKPVLGVGTEAR